MRPGLDLSVPTATCTQGLAALAETRIGQRQIREVHAFHRTRARPAPTSSLGSGPPGPSDMAPGPPGPSDRPCAVLHVSLIHNACGYETSKEFLSTHYLHSNWTFKASPFLTGRLVFALRASLGCGTRSHSSTPSQDSLKKRTRC